MDYLSDNGDSESDKLPGTHIKIWILVDVLLQPLSNNFSHVFIIIPVK
jgi:hypothetical protein